MAIAVYIASQFQVDESWGMSEVRRGGGGGRGRGEGGRG